MDAIDTTTESQFISHSPCDACGSSDANAVYDDGHTYCFSCQTRTDGDGETQAKPSKHKDDEQFLTGEYRSLKNRKLSAEDCRKYEYFVTEHKGEMVQVANYRDGTGRLVAQKVRNSKKEFTIVGNGRKMPFYGQHMWSADKILVICEGEIDTISASQARGHRWATVGLPNGCQSAVRSIKDNWDYVSKFQKVILCFDQDDAGREAALEAAQVLPIGVAHIATLPYKDVNECLVQGDSAVVVTALFQAPEYRPDGIVSTADTTLKSAISVDDTASSITYPFTRLNEITKGLRRQEVVTVCAGSGVGKTTLIRELGYHLHKAGEKLGLIMLEESNKRTLLGYIGLHLNKNITVDRSLTTDEEIEQAYEDLFPEDHSIYLYDHFGSSDIDVILQRMTYMVKALGVKWIILDHISILVSGLDSGDERKLIDRAMTLIRTKVQELDIGVIIVSHLRRPNGDKGHEDGEAVRLGQLRGSHAIAQLSDMTIALQKDKDDPDSDTRHLYILKNRYTGEVGYAGAVVYDRQTGRLLEEAQVF